MERDSPIQNQSMLLLMVDVYMIDTDNKSLRDT